MFFLKIPCGFNRHKMIKSRPYSIFVFFTETYHPFITGKKRQKTGLSTLTIPFKHAAVDNAKSKIGGSFYYKNLSLAKISCPSILQRLFHSFKTTC